MAITTRDGYTLKIRQGETYEKYFRWTLADGTTPVKLHNMTGSGQIRNGAFNQGIIAEIDVIIVDADNGDYKIRIPYTTTRTIPTTGYIYTEVEGYTYDVEFTDSDGEPYRVLQGPVEVSPEVTK